MCKKQKVKCKTRVVTRPIYRWPSIEVKPHFKSHPEFQKIAAVHHNTPNYWLSTVETIPKRCAVSPGEPNLSRLQIVYHLEPLLLVVP